MTLYSELSDILVGDWNYPSVAHTTYRGFYRIRVSKLGHPVEHTCFQSRLEHKRPLLDYIQLPDHSLLIGYSRDYADLKKAAVELTMQYLLDETKRHNDIHRKVLSSLGYILHHTKPMLELAPEEFL